MIKSRRCAIQSLFEGSTDRRERPTSREAHLAQGAASNSARYEYADRHHEQRQQKHRVWPPMMVTAIEARCSEPAPIPMATGMSPAMIESVVMRIGRSAYTIRLQNCISHGHALVAQIDWCNPLARMPFFLNNAEEKKHYPKRSTG